MSNRYKVQKKQWSKWAGFGRVMFNRLYGQLGRGEMNVLIKPCEPLSKEQARVLRRNLSWVAAGIAKEIQEELRWNWCVREPALRALGISLVSRRMKRREVRDERERHGF